MEEHSCQGTRPLDNSIENKIDSPEHTNQLNRYRVTVNKYYPNYEKQYIYLTPKRKKSSDPENWKSMSYADVLKIIDESGDKARNPEAVVLIRQYANMLRRDIVGDDELKKLCQKIYIKHKTALDINLANKPNNADVYQALTQWAEDKNEKAKSYSSLSYLKNPASHLRRKTYRISCLMRLKLTAS